MGFRQAAVLASVSFFTGTQVQSLSHKIADQLLGVLFICMNVDYRLLWSLDDQAVKDGFVFYTTFYHAPPAIRVRRMFHNLDCDSPQTSSFHITGTTARDDWCGPPRAVVEATQVGRERHVL